MFIVSTGKWQNPEIQRASNKVQEVSDLLRLLIELVEKVLDPAGIVWMDCLQELNLKKTENNNVKQRMRIGWYQAGL